MTLGTLVACCIASQQPAPTPTKWYAKATTAGTLHESSSHGLRLFSVRAERVGNRVAVRVCLDRDVALLKSRQAYFALNCEPGPTLIWNVKGPPCPTVPPISAGRSAVMTKEVASGVADSQVGTVAVAHDIRSAKAVSRLIKLSFDSPLLAEAVPYRARLYVLPPSATPGASVVKHEAGTAWFFASSRSSFDLDSDWP